MHKDIARTNSDSKMPVLDYEPVRSQSEWLAPTLWPVPLDYFSPSSVEIFGIVTYRSKIQIPNEFTISDVHQDMGSMPCTLAPKQ